MINIRDFEASDLDQCIRLLQVGHDPEFDYERFAWLHFKNALAPSRMAVAEEKGRIIGFYGVIKKRLNIEGKGYIGGRDIDPVVHPEFRGRGIFSRLLDYGLNNFREVDIFFNFANELSAPGFLKSGWRRVGLLEDCVFQAGVDLAKPKQLLLYYLCWGALHLRFKKPGESIRIKELPSESVTQFRDDLTVFTGSNIYVERDWAYLQWRYLQKPGQSYRFFLESWADCPQKLYITKLDLCSDEIILCDHVATTGTEPSLWALFDHFRQQGKTCKIKIWRSCPASFRREFVHKPFAKSRGCNFLVRSLPGKLASANVFELDRWFITHGDLEAI
jgi:GNAT superfamily N-acetyltransferase